MYLFFNFVILIAIVQLSELLFNAKLNSGISEKPRIISQFKLVPIADGLAVPLKDNFGFKFKLNLLLILYVLANSVNSHPQPLSLPALTLAALVNKSPLA